MNPKETSQILDSVSGDYIPANVNLLPAIKAHFVSKVLGRPQRIRLAPAIVLILLALGLLTGVVYAVAHSLGYIPGVGLVDLEHQVRVLDKPVSGGKDDITVTVKQVIADSARTKVTYAVAGIPWIDRGTPICSESPLLQLPDGQKIEPIVGSGGIGMKGEPGSTLSFETTLNFPPVPTDENTVYFLSPCEQPRLALKLVPAPAGFATSAVEIGATVGAFTPDATIPAPAEVGTGEVGTATSTPREVRTHTPAPAAPIGDSDLSGLHLDKVIELTDAYLLIGNFTDKGIVPGVVIISISDLDDQIQMTDAHGQALRFRSVPEVLADPQEIGAIAWAYEIPKPVDGPVTIRLASIPMNDEATTQFFLDAQTGQKWEINQNVRLAEYQFTIDTLEKTGQGYTIHFHSGPEVPDGLSFGLKISGSNASSTGEVSAVDSTDIRKPERVGYSQTLTYQDILPEGRLSLALTLSQTIQVPGPWTLTWSPPNSK